MKEALAGPRRRAKVAGAARGGGGTGPGVQMPSCAVADICGGAREQCGRVGWSQVGCGLCGVDVACERNRMNGTELNMLISGQCGVIMCNLCSLSSSIKSSV